MRNVEYLLAKSDRTWTTEHFAVPDNITDLRLVEWAERHLSSKFPDVILWGVYHIESKDDSKAMGQRRPGLALVDELLAKHEQAGYLLLELRRSVAIKDLFPDAEWPVKCCMHGNTGRVCFKITDKQGVFVLHPLRDVPRFLLAANASAEGERWIDEEIKRQEKHNFAPAKSIRESSDRESSDAQA